MEWVKRGALVTHLSAAEQAEGVRSWRDATGLPFLLQRLRIANRQVALSILHGVVALDLTEGELPHYTGTRARGGVSEASGLRE